MAINSGKLSTLPCLSGVLGPLHSRCPRYFCSLFLTNSLPSDILYVWRDSSPTRACPNIWGPVWGSVSGNSIPTCTWTASTEKRFLPHFYQSERRRSSSSALRSKEGCQGPRAGGELPTPAAQPGELSGEARLRPAQERTVPPSLNAVGHQGSRGAHLQRGEGVTALAPRGNTAVSNSHIYMVHTVKSERT